MPHRRQAAVLRAAARAPEALARRCAPRTDRLAPDLALLLRLVERFRWPALESMPLAAAQAEGRREARVLAGRRLAVRTEELTLPSGPARRFLPPGGATGGLLVWLHGGGWILGDLDSHDPLCRRLAVAAGVDVLAASYRLAPARFPAAVDDALAAVDWALDHHDGPVAVGGDSAGGALAAVAACTFGARLVAQVLLYPITDLSREHPSYAACADGPWLTAAHMRWFRAAYLADDAAARDPRASPLLARSLAGGPPAYVGIAGLDPLCDEGRAYAAKLRADGVPVTLEEFPRQMHGYAELAGVSRSARAATLAAARWLRHQGLPCATVTASPLTPDAASEQRKATTAATSAASTTRPAG